MKTARLSVLTLALVPAAPLLAGTGKEAVPARTIPAPAVPEVNLLTGDGVSLGGILFPHFHFNAVYGGTSSERGHELGAGHHDAVNDGWTVQGFETGLSLRAGEHVEGFATYHGYWANESPRDYDGSVEEWFGKLKNLPGGFEIRGGRYLNRFGLHNQVHLHGWDWLDNSLTNGRFLGDDGQSTLGGEISWTLPVSWTSHLSVSIGEAQTEEHGHGEEEEGGNEPRFEGEGALFAHTLVTANWTNLWLWNDFHQFRYGLSGAWGDNAWGRSTQLYGAHLQYEWRENGQERGGDSLRWRTEVMVRSADALSGHLPGEAHDGEADLDDGQPGSFRDWGLTTSLTWGHDLGSAGMLEAGLRYEFLRGVSDAALPERQRISPVLTYSVNRTRSAFVRAQYNYDRIGGGTENSVWLGFGLNWGGGEVR